MKIYINHFDDSKLDVVYDYNYKQHSIYSDEGIFVFKNNKLYKKEFTDLEVETKKIKTMQFIIDPNEESINECFYHIPFHHIFCEETFFKKNIGDSLIFVKHTYFDQTSYYFEVEGKFESFMLAKMFSFLI